MRYVHAKNFCKRENSILANIYTIQKAEGPQKHLKPSYTSTALFGPQVHLSQAAVGRIYLSESKSNFLLLSFHVYLAFFWQRLFTDLFDMLAICSYDLPAQICLVTACLISSGAQSPAFHVMNELEKCDKKPSTEIFGPDLN